MEGFCSNQLYSGASSGENARLYQGFTMTFSNGYGVSVQWHRGNYCDNRDGTSNFSATAEVAVLTPTEEYYWKEQVRGWQTPEEVLTTLNEIAALQS